MIAVTRRRSNSGKPAPTWPERRWTFLTNHGTVLLHIAGHPDDTMRSIAAALGLTERTTAAVIADLRAAGYLTVQRRGRHNHYTVNGGLPLRRQAHAQINVRDLLGVLANLLGSEEVPGSRRRPAGALERRLPKTE
jgi:DNA-binding transcriptional ArsR family regulator